MDIANELWVILISASPFVELRGAIPLGIAKGIGALNVFFLAILGNTIPIIPLLVFLKWSSFPVVFLWLSVLQPNF